MSMRNLVDAVVGGSLMNKSMDAVNNLLEETTLNNSHWGNKRQLLRKVSCLLEVDELTSVKA